MKLSKESFFSLMEGTKHFIIPLWQRPYRWDTKDCAQLWDDTVKFVRVSEGKSQGHFIGSMVRHIASGDTSAQEVSLVIDGQQRLTTFTLFVSALRDNLSVFETGLNKALLTDRYLKNKYWLDKVRYCEGEYKLLLRKPDKNALQSIVDDSTYTPDTNERLSRNYTFFFEKIDSGLRKGDFTPEELYLAMAKVYFVDIALESDEDDAQSIFESLNSTGKKLSVQDHIRNHVMLMAGVGESDRLYEKYWRDIELWFDTCSSNSFVTLKPAEYNLDTFFHHFLLANDVDAKLDNLYPQFKEYLKREYLLKGKTMVDFCSYLHESARVYSTMRKAANKDTDAQKLPVEWKKLYEDVALLGRTTLYPLLLRVHMDCSAGYITEDELKEIVIIVMSYVFRRRVCGQTSDIENMVFQSFGKKISRERGEYVSSIKSFLLNVSGVRVFPSDVEFKEKLIEYPIYNSVPITRHALKRLEQCDHSTVLDLSNAQIEHILPQDKNLTPEWVAALGPNWMQIQRKYVHTIGNLTWTMPEYNKQMGTKFFLAKRDMLHGYKSAAGYLNSFLLDATTWDESTLLRRSEILADIAINAWPYPHLNDAELHELAYINSSKERNLAQYGIKSHTVREVFNRIFDSVTGFVMSTCVFVQPVYAKPLSFCVSNVSFTDVIFKETALKLFIHIRQQDLVDPKGLCSEESGGKIRAKTVTLELSCAGKDLSGMQDEIEYAVSIIRQAYNRLI